MKHLMRMSIFRYSQAIKKNVVVVPKSWDFPVQNCLGLIEEIEKAQNCKIIATYLKDNVNLFTDWHIKYMYNHIGKFDLDIDDHFHTIIAPITLEYVQAFNRNNAAAITSILLTLSFRKISSDALWNACLKKLDEENIYRYCDLRETVGLFRNLAYHGGYIHHNAFKKIQKVIYQQKNYYLHYPELIQKIKEGVQFIQKSQGREKHQQITQAFKQIS